MHSNEANIQQLIFLEQSKFAIRELELVTEINLDNQKRHIEEWLAFSFSIEQTKAGKRGNQGKQSINEY